MKYSIILKFQNWCNNWILKFQIQNKDVGWTLPTRCGIRWVHSRITTNNFGCTQQAQKSSRHGAVIKISNGLTYGHNGNFFDATKPIVLYTTKILLVSLKTWDDELAELAKYNTMQCHMNHDQCHSTRLFWLSGQSLSVNYNIEDADMAAFAPNNWFSENSVMSVDNIANFQDLKENG